MLITQNKNSALPSFSIAFSNFVHGYCKFCYNDVSKYYIRLSQIIDAPQHSDSAAATEIFFQFFIKTVKFSAVLCKLIKKKKKKKGGGRE